MWKDRPQKPPKGSPKHAAGLRPYKVKIKMDDNILDIIAYDGEEARGMAANLLIKWKRARNFIEARRMIEYGRVAEKKKTRAPKKKGGTGSLPSWD